MEKQTLVEEFNGIEDGNKITISDDTVNQFRSYQETYHGNFYTVDQARSKLEANYRKEVETVSSKEVALKAMNAVRLVCPKVDGLEQREAGTLHQIRGCNAKLNGVSDRMDDLEQKIKDHNEKMLVALKAIQAHYKEIVEKEEQNSEPKKQPSLLHRLFGISSRQLNRPPPR